MSTCARLLSVEHIYVFSLEIVNTYIYFNVLAGGMEDLQKAVPTRRLGLKKLKTFAAQISLFTVYSVVLPENINHGTVMRT